ncbi:MAG: tRNA uridine-5-carboxymethylaminomethyl(34) synthesis GTPase MnmE, partial [Bdellovibrionales bacterium]|nr:tRNA uridine-5-carboxymethylaminomethyl(34) synthesis GTPase MnmE [Bdellovibrionales bacterium]
MTTERTIAALATAAMPAGVAVIRVSGSLVKQVLATSFQARKDPVQHPREMIYGTMQSPSGSQRIDTGLAVFFPGPRSFTGEDCCEFHLHGSPLLAKKFLEALWSNGVEPARPGEFSERAFLNGKIDLLQAEAIADIIEAHSERALAIAQSQFEGQLSGVLD